MAEPEANMAAWERTFLLDVSVCAVDNSPLSTDCRLNDRWLEWANNTHAEDRVAVCPGKPGLSGFSGVAITYWQV